MSTTPTPPANPSELLEPAAHPTPEHGGHRLFEIGAIIAWATLFIAAMPAVWRWTSSHPLAALAAAATGWAIADLSSGVVHWLADRFGSGQTPFLGRAFITPFREHHVVPGEIATHDFVEANGNTAIVSLPVVIGLLVGVSVAPLGPATGFVATAVAALALGVLWTNQAHLLAHHPAPPAWARALQRVGLILPPAVHARHHRDAHDRAYCITTGWNNGWLDATGLLLWLEPRIKGWLPASDVLDVDAGSPTSEP